MQDIQHCFEELKNDIKLELDSCRTNPNVGDLRYGSLKLKLINFLIYNKNSSLYGKTWEKIEEELDALNIPFSWKMVYDDNMINRMIQLLNNEYRKDELEILIDRQADIHSQHSGFEQDAMWAMKVDTSKVFKSIQDSLNKCRNKLIHPNLYQNFDVFQYMKLDTTPRFYFVLDSVKKVERESKKNYYLTQYHFDIQRVIKPCASINDERLVRVLINLSNKLTIRTEELIQILQKNETIGYNERWKIHDEKKNNENIIYVIKETLARLKIEPYYSDFLKSVTLSLEEIKELEFGGYIEPLSRILRSQEAFLEISKYLHSSAATTLTGDGELLGKAYGDAYRKIREYIKNKDLWDIMNKPDFNLETDRFEIYDWMQKNYGKYEIKRIW
jgi:hypothetical protein